MKKIFAEKKFEIFTSISVILILIVMLFGCIVCKTTDYQQYYTGYQAIFGYSSRFSDVITIPILKFNIVGLLSLVFLVIGAVVNFLKNKVVNILGIVLMIAGTIMLFFLDNSVVLESLETKNHYQLAIGGYIVVILGFLGTYFAIYKYLLKSKKQPKI